MYKKTILALAVFAVILTWHASDAKLFLDEYELEEYQWDSLTKTGTGKTGTKASSTKAKKSGAKGGKKTDATKKPADKTGGAGAGTGTTGAGKKDKVTGGAGSGLSNSKVSWWVWAVLVVAVFFSAYWVYTYGFKKDEGKPIGK